MKVPRLRMKTQYTKCAGCVGLAISESGKSYKCKLGHTIHYTFDQEGQFPFAPKPVELCRKPKTKQHLDVIIEHRKNKIYAKKSNNKDNP